MRAAIADFPRLPRAIPGSIPGASHPPSACNPPMSVRELYEGLVGLKKIERDRAQQALLGRLEAVEQRVATHRSARRVRPSGWLFGSRDQVEPVKGLYVYGDVGRGKTMMMDLFFEASPVVRKRRAHFHEF